MQLWIYVWVEIRTHSTFSGTVLSIVPSFGKWRGHGNQTRWLLGGEKLPVRTWRLSQEWACRMASGMVTSCTAALQNVDMANWWVSVKAIVSISQPVWTSGWSVGAGSPLFNWWVGLMVLQYCIGQCLQRVASKIVPYFAICVSTTAVLQTTAMVQSSRLLTWPPPSGKRMVSRSTTS